VHLFTYPGTSNKRDHMPTHRSRLMGTRPELAAFEVPVLFALLTDADMRIRMRGYADMCR